MTSSIRSLKSSFLTNCVSSLSICIVWAMPTVAAAQDPVTAPTDLAPYFQNFDLIATGNDSNPDLPSTLYAADPWRVFGNAFNSQEEFLFGYGPFVAPNLPEDQAGGFVNVDAGEPTTSGDNYLNIFNDYDNELHNDGSNSIVSALVFQERNVLPENVGEVWVFAFDYRSAVAPFGIANNAGSGNVATAGAFVKVLESSTGNFFQIDRLSFDTTDATLEFQRGSIEFEITEAHVGERLQFGFESAASNVAPTGVYYDTVSFAVAGDTVLGDFDGNLTVDCADLDSYVGILDSSAAGQEQLDLTGDGMITIDDANLHITTLVQATNGVVGTFPADLNCDGAVDVLGDAFILVGSLGTSVSSYSAGDINFDGSVDVLGDAFILVGNLGMSNAE